MGLNDFEDSSGVNKWPGRCICHWLQESISTHHHCWRQPLEELRLPE
jgi:hypothetical protein